MILYFIIEDLKILFTEKLSQTQLAIAAVLSCIIGWIVFNKKQNDVMQRI